MARIFSEAVNMSALGRLVLGRPIDKWQDLFCDASQLHERVAHR
jgi:hypothetical protein